MKNSRTYLRLLFIGCCLSLLAGCASMGHRSQGRPTLSANDYLQLAATSQGVSKQGYLLKAANRLIQDQQLAKAENIINKVQNDLPTHLMVEKQLTGARLLIAYRQNGDALMLLDSMSKNTNTWTRENKIEWHQLSATAYANRGNITASIEQRSQLTPLLSSKVAKKQNLLTIWESLQSISPSDIKTVLTQTSSPAVRGWLTLAQLTDQSETSPKQLMQQLQQWHYQYPKHPATALLPSSLQALKNVAAIKPKRIALLLPLKGRYAKAGNAIRNGFFAAYYYARQTGLSTPAISVIDTTKKNIVTAYHEAIQDGADFVVGPLIKNNISTLAKSTNMTVPTLALNSLPNDNQTISNLYQFGLSPIDEATQAAMKARNSHHLNALIITTKSKWGEQIADAFTKTFQALGGRIAGSMQYSNQKNLSKEIEQLLNIDQASWRKTALKKMLREKIRFVPRRRKDIDMVFLVAQPAIARQVRPLLRFYYAGSIPVYATSTVYTGTPNPNRDHDLNGILFCDMPWVLSKKQLQPSSLNEIRDRIQQIWPTTFAHRPKLFALGVDAYEIIPKLNKMTVLPQFGTRAATGTLYLSKNHRIYRKLDWSQIVRGTPRLIQ